MGTLVAWSGVVPPCGGFCPATGGVPQSDVPHGGSIVLLRANDVVIRCAIGMVFFLFLLVFSFTSCLSPGVFRSRSS